MNKKLFLSADGLTIGISCSENTANVIFEKREAVAAVLPLAVLHKGDKVDKEVFLIDIRKSDAPGLIVQEKSIIYNDPSNDLDVSAFLYTILTPVLSVLLLRRSRLFMHGAVVEKGNRGFMLAGRGKTTTAYNLCRKYSCNLVAEDNFIYVPEESMISASCRSMNIDKRLLGMKDGGKCKISLTDCGIRNRNNVSINAIFFLSNYFETPAICKVEGYEKSSIVCTLVNERLMNYSRWNTALNSQPPILMSVEDFNKRNTIISQICTKLPVIKVESAINNNHELIRKYLNL